MYIQFRELCGSVDDHCFTFAVEGLDDSAFAQGIWCEIMAETVKSPNLSASGPPAGLAGLQSAAAKAAGPERGPAPVHLWNPPFCGDIGMRIARDGTWFYQGTPIGRLSLVKLFASILRRDPERYVLVTPVEMVSIEVEDAPFLAVELRVEDGPEGRILSFRTNVDDWVTVDREHPLRFESGPSGGIKPYLRVRGDLWALVTRALLYDLVDLGGMRSTGGMEDFGVMSSGEFFVIANAGIETPEGGAASGQSG